MLTRLARWWLGRKTRPAPLAEQVGECTACAGPADHTIVATFNDGAESEAGGGGGTGMSADYCAGHCPGGCLQGCPTLTV